jgi:hypothetical protein
MREASRLLVAIFVFGLICSPSGRAAGIDDGRRALEVKRYGIAVRVPLAWRLITWGRDNQAFVLKLPQDSSASKGFVKCELGIAPESLDEYQKRQQAAEAERPKLPGVKRRLVKNSVEALDEARFGKLARQLGQRLLSVWEIEGAMGDRSFEVATSVIVHGTLYTFTLTTDEAHFEAYRLDFDEMLASSVFNPPETGLQRLPGGLWMQRDFRFALRLPTVLFFATGDTSDGVTDNVVVLATPPKPLDLEHLKTSLAEEIQHEDEKAQVTCQIVPQGRTFALETVIQTTRDGHAVTVLERRFRSKERNYEVKFSCRTSEFPKVEAELRQSLDSFREVLNEPSGPAA